MRTKENERPHEVQNKLNAVKYKCLTFIICWRIALPYEKESDSHKDI